MALKSIRIENFKSIGEIEIVNPQPFSVLVGANASGKSNIFAALQFLHHVSNSNSHRDVVSGFGGVNDLLHINSIDKRFRIAITFDDLYSVSFLAEFKGESNKGIYTHFENPRIQQSFARSTKDVKEKPESDLQFVSMFSRIFVHRENLVFQKVNDGSKLSLDAKNLEHVLKRILNDPDIKDEFIETLQLFIPGLDKVDVVSSEFSSNLDLFVYEKALKRPINKELISDGTYNIIAILTALYQSKTPQFLCIEEPENGLTPYVLKQLVAICKDLCEERGHYIWLNTHSQTIVSQLKPEEIILVDKKDGFTQIKQFEKGSFGDMPMDEAWLTNTLGGGLPW